MATLLDSYPTSNLDDVLPQYAGVEVRVGQCFTGNGNYLYSAKFYNRKVGSPTGNVVAKLYAHTGTFGTNGTPTGTVLATSSNFDISTLGVGYSLTEFIFPAGQNYLLVNATHYCIEIDYSGGDSSNYLVTGMDSSAPTFNGSAYYSDNGTSFSTWASGVRTIIFYVYGIASFNYTLTAIVGQFSLTGINIGLSKAWKAFSLSVGQFVLTGINVILDKGGSDWLNITKSVTSTFLNQSIHTGTKTNQPKSSTSTFKNIKKT